MATANSFSQGSIISFSRTEKLNWKNYRAWSNLKQEVEILEENEGPWLKLDYQLYAILWQSVNRELLEILRDVFANDVQRLFDSTQKIVSLQQNNHDMVLPIAKARAAAEELKGLLPVHPDYEHVRDQILSSQHIPSMNSLVTRLLRVPTIMKGDGIVVENSAMVASRGRGRNGRGGRGKLICSHCEKEGYLQNRCYDLIGWPDKTASSDIPSNGRTSSQLISDEEYQELLRLKSNNHSQSSASPSVSTACISHSMESQGSWIIDSGASDHISGHDSVFSSISSPEFPHFISLANGSKMVSQGVGQVSLSSSISLNSMLYIPRCSYNLISLSQLTRSLNCLVTFYADSFVIQDQNTGQLIGEGHESRGLYYLSNNPSTLCFASVSPKLLHNRLGHPNLAKLKLMVPSLNKLSTLDCESCQLSKHVRSTFPSQVNKKCNFHFSVVHSKIWGPS
ncbi:hypothetical protein CR513_30468, partial [Mucuna pruriens]